MREVLYAIDRTWKHLFDDFSRIETFRELAVAMIQIKDLKGRILYALIHFLHMRTVYLPCGSILVNAAFGRASRC